MFSRKLKYFKELKMVHTLLFWLVCVCACAAADTIPDPIPNYSQIQKDIDQVMQLLQTHVTSMKSKVPNLKDHRRHYTVIVYVIYYLAWAHSACVPLPYFDVYQTVVNHAAPDAISDAEYVVTQVEFGINEFNNKTALVQQTVRQYCGENEITCDEAINNVIYSVLGPNIKQLSIYVSAAAGLREFIKKHDEILSQSQNHSALEYVIDEDVTLEKVVYSLADLLKILRPLYLPYTC